MDEKLLKKYKRSILEEDRIIKKFSDKLIGEFSFNEVKERLNKNGFKGVYVLPSEDFYKVRSDLSAEGFYTSLYKVIVINKDAYKYNKNIGVHEMTHAFIDSKQTKKIDVEDNEEYNGYISCKGLEEGAASLLERVSNINNIERVDLHNCTYVCQSLLFRQLNILYKNSKFKKYNNLLIHFLKESDSFIELITNIYSSSLDDSYSLLVLQSSYYMIHLLDEITFNNDIYTFKYLCYLNTLYYCANNPLLIKYGKIDKDFKNYISDNLIIDDCTLITCKLFNDRSFNMYKEQIKKYIEKYISIMITCLDSFNNQKFTYSFSKKLDKNITLK